MSEDTLFFTGDSHKKRFLSILQKLDKIHDGVKIDQEYGAAIYILTAEYSTWEKASYFVSRSGIRFDKMLKLADWSGGYTVLLQWAANLFGHNIHVDPVELMRLDDTNYQIAKCALDLRRHEWHIGSVVEGGIIEEPVIEAEAAARILDTNDKLMKKLIEKKNPLTSYHLDKGQMRPLRESD